MGFHVEAGTSSKTPVFCFNNCGVLSWCGIEISEITEKQAWEMRRFVEVEAYKQGYYAADGDSRWNPFEPKLLFGYPYRRWHVLFQNGLKDKAQGQDYQQYQCYSENKDGSECNLWPSVSAALLSLADQTESAYRELGVIRNSVARGTFLALVGWFNPFDEDFVSAM